MALRNLFGSVALEGTQSENRTILDMILNFMEDLVNSAPRKDTQGRQCVRIETMDSGTVTTVGALNSLGVYSSQMIPFQASFPTHIYDRIVVS